MPGEIRLQIDDQTVSAREGTMLIEVARGMGIDIPSLCYNRQLEPYGGCRMCCVEVDSGTGRRLVVSCGYPAADGLKVWTRSPEIDRIRRFIVELSAPLVAPKGSVKGKLGRMAAQYNADLDEFAEKSVCDPNGCSLCGLCVNTCSEVVGASTIGFVGRGVDRQVVMFPAAGCNYHKCKKCFAMCFTGKIAKEAAETVFPDASIDEYLERRGVKVHSLRALVRSDDKAVD